MSDSEFKDWCAIIRATALTSKCLTSWELNRDCKVLEGEDIPFRKFACRTLDDMLRKIPGLKISQQGGKTVVQAIPTEETAHISRMVKQQKTAKKKPKVPPSYNKNYFHRPYNRNVPHFNNTNKYNVPRYSANENSRPNNFQHRPNSAEPQKRPATAPKYDMSKRMTPPSPINTSAANAPFQHHQKSNSGGPASPPPAKKSPTRKTPSPSHSPILTASHNGQQGFANAGGMSNNSSSSNSGAGIQQRLNMREQQQQQKQPQPQSHFGSSARPQSATTTPTTPSATTPYTTTPKSYAPSAISQRLIAAAQPKVQQQQQVPPPKSPKSPPPRSSSTTATANSASRTPAGSGSGMPTTSSPIAANAAPAMPPSPTSFIQHDGDPRLRLNSYAEARKLPLPVYKDLPTKDQNIYSSVTVNSKKYSSYPREAKTKDEAEKIAAQVALDDLVGKDQRPDVTTYDRNLVMSRVLKIVNDHPNGLFESSVIESYVARFRESLPANWLKLVENVINVDLGANNLVILSPQKEDVQRRPSSPSTLLEPDVLQLNDTEFWLHVYVVYSSTDIWGVIIDENHSDKIDALAKDMMAFYESNQVTPSSIVPGKYYAVFDSDWWHRVRCIKVDPVTQQATLFFIDRGDEDMVALSKLHPLETKFCQLPAQSVRVSLEGLEVFENCPKTQTLIEDMLVDKSVYVRSEKLVHGYAEERYMATVSAQLYIAQDDKEMNVNESLKKEILKSVVDPKVNLGTDKISQEVHISFVSEKAIYVQLKSKGLNYLQALMNNIEMEFLKKPNYIPRTVLSFDTSKVYLIKSSEDNNLYRVRIEKVENGNEVHVFCIDVGNSMIVTRKDLILLEDLSSLLAEYPNQALKVRLHKISPLDFDKKMAAHLQELAPKKEVFYMKVVGSLEETPVVEFYKRTENNFLASVNDTLALEPELHSRDDNNNTKQPRLRNDRSGISSRSDFPLKAPYIPPVGSFFDVHITMAAHPGNFTVQSFNTIHKLETLMVELAQVCDKYNGPALTPGSVKVGSMYAAKYDEDGRWYRAYVSKVISKNVCAVYFCDYGDYRAVSLEQLQPLQSQFYDLPYQAIKAKLFGITPKLKGDWTVKDSLRFNELIVTKNFVSVIKSCNVESTLQGETILSLELIDTSTTEDIYISNILVSEKRAEKIEQLYVENN